MERTSRLSATPDREPVPEAAPAGGPALGRVGSWTRRDDRAVITARGYLNLRAGRELARLARRLMREGARALTFDLGGVELVNHQGIGELLAAEREAGKLGGELSFRGLSPALRTMLRIMGHGHGSGP